MAEPRAGLVLGKIDYLAVEGQVIQQDDRMCSTEEDEKKEGQCQGSVPAESHQPSATSHLG